ncbi:hypothetical protein L210DRAFT_3510920 [Boletus edulis BED1]|uniref:Uncharacterized protein n=1 Tax=Boletus edulis BED1 TaxID=1328754 RepID=A0AAD4BCE6_BOLED|nr:hypothetical protein L210DRAFT_3510920 [Boletus edulis BED1]
MAQDFLEFLRKHPNRSRVQELVLAPSIYVLTVTDIINLSPDLKALTIPYAYRHMNDARKNPLLVPLENLHALKSLSIGLFTFRGRRIYYLPNIPVFNRLTHLNLAGKPITRSTVPDGLADLVKLTHLSIHWSTSRSCNNGLLAFLARPATRVLVIWYPLSSSLTQLVEDLRRRHVLERRVVLFQQERYHEYMADGGFWPYAERLIDWRVMTQVPDLGRISGVEAVEAAQAFRIFKLRLKEVCAGLSQPPLTVFCVVPYPMEDIHHPSTFNSPSSTESSPSTESGPVTPPLLNPSGFFPPHTPPMNDKSKMEPSHFSISVPSPPERGSDSGKQFPENAPQSTVQQRTVASNQRMRRMLSSHKHHPSARPLEARFTMRSLGVSSHTSLSIEDVVEGKDIFQEGLSDMPDSVFEKFYNAKLAARDTILSRISSSLREIDVLEKMRDAVLEYVMYNKNLLVSGGSDMERYKAEVNNRTDDLEDRIAYGHAVYADELAALTVSNTQLQYMLNPPSDPEPSDESDSDASDDLVYEQTELSAKHKRWTDGNPAGYPRIRSVPGLTLEGSSHASGATTQSPQALLDPTLHPAFPTQSSQAFVDPTSRSYPAFPPQSSQAFVDPTPAFSAQSSHALIDPTSYPAFPTSHGFVDPTSVGLGHPPQIAPPFNHFRTLLPQQLPEPFYSRDPLEHFRSEVATGTNCFLDPTSVGISGHPPVAPPFNNFRTPLPQLLPEPFQSSDPLGCLRPEVATSTDYTPASSELQQIELENVEKQQHQTCFIMMPPPLPQLVTFASDLEITKTQIEDISKRVKHSLYAYMFTTNPVPLTKKERERLINDSIKNASEMILGYSPPPKRGHYHKLCIDTMSNARSAFRKYAENTVETFFNLDLPIRSTENVTEHRCNAAQSLLSKPDLNFFHVFDKTPMYYTNRTAAQGAIFYFEHQAISKLIEHVMGTDLKCTDVLRGTSMKPVIALAAASFKLALARRTTAPEEPAGLSDDRLVIERGSAEYTLPRQQHRSADEPHLALSCMSSSTVSMAAPFVETRPVVSVRSIIRALPAIPTLATRRTGVIHYATTLTGKCSRNLPRDSDDDVSDSDLVGNGGDGLGLVTDNGTVEFLRNVTDPLQANPTVNDTAPLSLAASTLQVSDIPQTPVKPLPLTIGPDTATPCPRAPIQTPRHRIAIRTVFLVSFLTH